jgi:carbamate kinase
MAKPARQRETLHSSAIYRYHPMFAAADFVTYYGGDDAAIEDGFGTPHARPIHWASPGELRTRCFPAGSMGPKVEAVCRFVEATGKMAGIGNLADAEALLRRDAGTTVTPG